MRREVNLRPSTARTPVHQLGDAPGAPVFLEGSRFTTRELFGPPTLGTPPLKRNRTPTRAELRGLRSSAHRTARALEAAPTRSFAFAFFS
jgi:hypothetical protein